MSGLWAALQFLTRLPTPSGGPRFDVALAWFPVVGALLGAILAILDAALQALGVAPLLRSTLLVVALLGLSGALHADGLMDTCDALLCHATPQRRLEIMRDPHPGAFGVVGLLSVFALKVAAIDALPTPPALRAPTLVLAPTLGRWAIVLLVAAFPYGRPQGLGTPLKAGVTPRRVALASALPLLVGLLVWPVGPILLVLAAATTGLVGAWLMRHLPGLTGDCYGAGCELVETVTLASAAPLAHAFGWPAADAFG